MPARLVALLFDLLLLGAACGPINSTTHIIDARDMFKEARRIGGEVLAPYEYTKAELYLRKAKELQGHSEYQQSVVFAIRAKDMANDAIKVSRRNEAKRARLEKVRKGKGAK